MEQNLVFQSIYREKKKKRKEKSCRIIRSGEYEGLLKELIDPQWKPDFGPSEFNKSVEKSELTAFPLHS